MPQDSATRNAVLGLDVGKSAHWACLVTRAGEIVLNRPVANSDVSVKAKLNTVA